jgi:hypothetical protein
MAHMTDQRGVISITLKRQVHQRDPKNGNQSSSKIHHRLCKLQIGKMMPRRPRCTTTHGVINEREPLPLHLFNFFGFFIELTVCLIIPCTS